MPVVEASRAQRPTVEINPASTDISALVSLHIQMGAAAAMTRLAHDLGIRLA